MEYELSTLLVFWFTLIILHYYLQCTLTSMEAKLCHLAFFVCPIHKYLNNASNCCVIDRLLDHNFVIEAIQKFLQSGGIYQN